MGRFKDPVDPGPIRQRDKSGRASNRKEEKEAVRIGMVYFVKLKPIKLKGGLR